ncbi:hypothetical protein ACF06Q_13510 [Streptomyces leeuwenhoekii]|uniref:hypothetical protein n=1 Tax=Streptomyces leeuwenhoekii TaxID=1437453 RepID=UPI0036FE2110
MTRPRLLPWSEDGKPTYLDTSNPNSVLSRLADQMEEAQLTVGQEIFDRARRLLEDPDASRSELRFTAIRLVECLFDALRIAESRGERLDDIEEADEEAATSGDDGDKDTTTSVGQEADQ